MSIRSTTFAALCAVLSTAHAADSGIDGTFGDAGWRRLFEPGGGAQDDTSIAFARTADGGYVVAGEVPGGAANGGAGKRIGLFRLDRDGHFVTSGFGTSGRVFKDAWLTGVADMTIDAQGRIVVVGPTPGPGGLADFGIVRFNADGSDDTGFAGDGGTSIGFDGALNFDDQPTSVLAEPDGRIVVAGNSTPQGLTSRFAAVRLTAGGSLDQTWGSVDDGAGGRRGTLDVFVSDKAAYASRILRIADGYYVIAGTSVYSGSDTDFAARILTPSGSPWAAFVGSATFPIDEPGPGGSLFDTVRDAILVDPTTILLVGSASGKFAATRIEVGTGNSGSQYETLDLDPAFVGQHASASCSHCYVGPTPGSSCGSAAVRPLDGRILLVGGTSSPSVGMPSAVGVAEPTGNTFAHAGLATRLNADGSPDAGFGIGGSYLYAAPGGGSQSYHTEFGRVRFDGMQAVILGNAVDDSMAVSDFDGVMTRLASDRIFANGFD